MKCNKYKRFLIFALLGVVGVGCDFIGNPVYTTTETVKVAGDPTGIIQEEQTSSHQTLVSVVDSLSLVVTENQKSVVLSWEQQDGVEVTLVRTKNADCNPIESTGCDEQMRIRDIRDNGYSDDNIVQGGVYYYWITAQSEKKTNNDSDKTGQTSVAELSLHSATHPEVVATSQPLRAEIAILEDLDAFIPEQPGVAFPQNVRVTGGEYVEVDWDYQLGFEVLVFATKTADCDIGTYLRDFFGNTSSSDVAEVSDCAVQVGRATTQSIRIENQTMAQKPFLWVLVATTGTGASLANIATQAQSHRLIGPYVFASNTSSDELPLTLIEKSQRNAHNVEIHFQQFTRYLPTMAEYHLIVISSLNALDIQKAQNVLEKNYADKFAQKGYDLSEDDLAFGLRTFGNVQTKKLRTSNFIDAGSALSYVTSVDSSQWYTIFLRVTDGITMEKYTPTSMRSATRLHVDVQGKYGLWQVANSDNNVVFSMRDNGNFYTGLVDWRHFSLVAAVAKPAFWSYYFTGCPYYTNSTDVDDKQHRQLHNNRCLMAQTDEQGIFISPFQKPPSVRVTFEPHASVVACKKYQVIDNVAYKRSRYARATNTQSLLCDYRKVSGGSEANPFYYTFVQPHGAPAEIAKGKVDMWHGGTQTPLFLDAGTELPVLAGQQRQARVCADFAPNDTTCDWQKTVDVVRCNGYFSYRLADPSGCSVAYALEEDSISAIQRLLSK